MDNQEDFGILNINLGLYKTRLSARFRKRKLYQPADPKKILSFIPGTVIGIMVKEGQQVKKGETLIVLDAMKMQNCLKCNMDGKIKAILVSMGYKVSKGTLLIELE